MTSHGPVSKQNGTCQKRPSSGFEKLALDSLGLFGLLQVLEDIYSRTIYIIKSQVLTSLKIHVQTNIIRMIKRTYLSSSQQQTVPNFSC